MEDDGYSETSKGPIGKNGKKLIIDFIKSSLYLNYFKAGKKKKISMQTSKLLEEKSDCRKSRRKVGNKRENIFIDMIQYTINKR